MIFLINNKKGFSVLEIVICLGIVSISMLGILSLSLQSVKTQKSNKTELVASMLAQEGLELVRNIRDENWINGTASNWMSDLNDSDGTFIIDMRGRSSLDDTPNDFSSALTTLYTDMDGFYTHDNTGTASNFKRIIRVISDSINGEDYLKVSSEVQWFGFNGRLLVYKADTELYDWR